MTRACLLSAFLFSLTLLPCSMQAQERTAPANLPQETTWHALQDQSNATLSQANIAHITTTAANAKLAKIEACAKLGKLYAPGASGADPVTGCRSNIALTGCYERSGGAGVHVKCNDGEIITKVCTAGRDPDCINSGGARLYTVITCCSITGGKSTPNQYTDSQGQQTQGTVLTAYNARTGYAILLPTGGSTLVYAYSDAIQASGLRTLKSGQRFTFELVNDPKRSGQKKAVNLKSY